MGTTLLRNGKVIDGTGKPAFQGHLLIENDRIKEVLPGPPRAVPPGAIRIDCRHQTLLPGLIDLKKRFRCNLIIDEAHSIGALGPSGRGIAHHFPGIDPKDVDLWMGTLSKSLRAVEVISRVLNHSYAI
jgi:hypothetical protein